MRTGGLGLLLLVLVGFNWAQVPFVGNQNCACGKAEKTGKKRIVGGTPTEINKYPWMVAVQMDESTFCGGTIISRNWVLTAAHCVIDNVHDPKPLIVYTHVYSFNRFKPAGLRRRVLSIITYNYNKELGRHDIALLRLDRPLPLTRGIQPVCLPLPRNYERSQVIAAGWGRTKTNGPFSEVPLEVNLQLSTDYDCRRHYESWTDIYPEMMCASDPGGKKDACEGDSGGPLIFNCKTHYIQVGIVSWGGECASDDPGVYTNLTQFGQWISSMTKDDTLCFQIC